MNATRLVSIFSVVFMMISGVSNAQELTVDGVFPSDRVLEVQIDVAPDDWESIRYVTRDLRTELGAKRQFGPLESPYEYVKADITIDGVKFKMSGFERRDSLVHRVPVVLRSKSSSITKTKKLVLVSCLH